MHGVNKKDLEYIHEEKYLITDWRTLVPKVVERLKARGIEVTPKQVMVEIDTYAKKFREAFRNYANVDYDLYMLGSVRPKYRDFKNKWFTYQKIIERYNQKEELTATEKKDMEKMQRFVDHYNRYMEINDKGRANIKGNIPPHELNKK